MGQISVPVCARTQHDQQSQGNGKHILSFYLVDVGFTDVLFSLTLIEPDGTLNGVNVKNPSLMYLSRNHDRVTKDHLVVSSFA